ncbi:MAG: ribosomal protein S18-alanine N-acetyltransferase [Gammaproteobacteria bacterium]|nr:ribosomal protein S18-alanine N-acetyltransferase [Gammaproteobacteria bacterium]
MGKTVQDPDLNIHRMNRQMLDSVMYVERRAYDFGWRRDSFQNCLDLDFECWVVESGNQYPPFTVAHAILSVVVDQAELLNLTVDPNWQHRGLGRTLLKHMVSRAEIQGATFITLEVRKSNYKAMNLYDSLGFKQVGIRKDYYQSNRGRSREDAYVMRLEFCQRTSTKLTN